MRTTINIDDQLFYEAKRIAVESQTPKIRHVRLLE